MVTDTVILLTTGQVARRLGLHQQTVIRLIDRGLLAGFRLPGSLHRRVWPEALEEFRRRYPELAAGRSGEGNDGWLREQLGKSEVKDGADEG